MIPEKHLGPRSTCEIVGTLTTIGAALTGLKGTAAAIAGGLAVAGTATSTGLSIAQAAGAFDPKLPDPPSPEDTASLVAAQADRRRGFVRRELAPSEAQGQAQGVGRPSILGVQQ